MRIPGLSIFLALGLHAGVLLVARSMPPLSQLTSKDFRDLSVIDIELPNTPPPEPLEAPAPPPPDRVDPTLPTPDRPLDPRVASVVRPSVPSPGPQPSSTGEPSPDNNPPPTQPRSKFDDLPPEQRGSVLGVPGVLGTPAWQIPGVLTNAPAAAPAPTAPPAPRPVDRNIAGKVLVAELDKRDKNLGLQLPVAGSMSSAIRTAVNGTELPTGTRGTIECRVGPNGQVSGCRVVSSNGGSSSAWGAALAAAGAVGGGALPSNYARGAIVSIDISVSETPPAGGKGGLSGAGAKFDLSNIGAHATRMVRTTFRVAAIQ